MTPSPTEVATERVHVAVEAPCNPGLSGAYGALPQRGHEREGVAISSGERAFAAGSITASSAGDVPPRFAIEVLREHPRFREALQVLIRGLVESYSHDGLLNRVVNDRGRLVGSLIALYLHFSPAPGDGGGGLTAGRFQAFCVDLKLCSPGRARALLLLMRYAGYLAPEPSASDLRRRCLAPTARLIEAHQQRWKLQFEAMAPITPAGRVGLELQGRPGFTAAFVRHLGASYLGGFRLLDHAPELTRLVESNAGLLVVGRLLLAALDGSPGPDGGTAVAVSITSLSAQFGIARAHARNLIAGAAEAGLVRRTGRSETVVVLPRLVQAGSGFFGALFGLTTHCVQAAAEEVGATS